MRFQIDDRRPGTFSHPAARTLAIASAVLLGLAAGFYLGLFPTSAPALQVGKQQPLLSCLGSRRGISSAAAAAVGSHTVSAVSSKVAKASTSRTEGAAASAAPTVLLDDGKLRRGIVSHGDEARVRRVMAKLLRGEPITLAVVGGSIAWGHGAFNIGVTDFGPRIFAWLREAFPTANHTFQNGAIPGTPSAYMALCVRWHVPPTADLVVVEYALNDGYHAGEIQTHWLRRSFERLIRKLMIFPQRPAIIQLATFPYEFHNYWQTGEDQQGVIAQFYGLPWLSLRGATWDASQRRVAGFRVPDIMDADERHPNDRGHQIMADLVTGYLASVAAELAGRPYDVASEDVVVQQELLPPLMPGNVAHPTENCIMDEEFHSFVRHADGFDWIVEGGAGSKRPKPGYISTRPGATLRFVMDTTATAAAAVDAPSHTTQLTLSYLASYEHMGKAEVTCLSGCTCEASTFDGHWERRESQLTGHRLSISQHAACEVQVRVLEDTSSGEHKVKITGVVMADEAGEMPSNLDVLIRKGDQKGFSSAQP